MIKKKKKLTLEKENWISKISLMRKIRRWLLGIMISNRIAMMKMELTQMIKKRLRGMRNHLMGKMKKMKHQKMLKTIKMYLLIEMN